MVGDSQLMTSAIRDEPQITEAFRGGVGVGWHEHNHGVFEGCERNFRPGYEAFLVAEWIPALEAVEESCAGSVADVGCGHGASTTGCASRSSRRRASPARAMTRDGASTLLCTRASFSQEVGLGLGAQAGEDD